MKNQQILTERKALLAKIKKHLLRGDLALIAESTGFTRQYVRKVLSPSFATHNLQIIDAALALCNKRQLESMERAQKAVEL